MRRDRESDFPVSFFYEICDMKRKGICFMPHILKCGYGIVKNYLAEE